MLGKRSIPNYRPPTFSALPHCFANGVRRHLPQVCCDCVGELFSMRPLNKHLDRIALPSMKQPIGINLIGEWLEEPAIEDFSYL